jgi:hypothetical protein
VRAAHKGSGHEDHGCEEEQRQGEDDVDLPLDSRRTASGEEIEALYEDYGHQEEQRQGADDVHLPLDSRRTTRGKKIAPREVSLVQ